MSWTKKEWTQVWGYWYEGGEETGRGPAWGGGFILGSWGKGGKKDGLIADQEQCLMDKKMTHLKCAMNFTWHLLEPLLSLLPKKHYPTWTPCSPKQVFINSWKLMWTAWSDALSPGISLPPVSMQKSAMPRLSPLCQNIAIGEEKILACSNLILNHPNSM